MRAREFARLMQRVARVVKRGASKRGSSGLEAQLTGKDASWASG